MSDNEQEDFRAHTARESRRWPRGPTTWVRWFAAGATVVAGFTWGPSLETWIVTIVTATAALAAMAWQRRQRSCAPSIDAGVRSVGTDRDRARRLALVFDHAAVGMVLLDGEHWIVDANPSFAALVGHTRIALGRRSFLDFVDASHAGSLVDSTRRARLHGGCQDVEVRLLAAGGVSRAVWIQVASATAVPGEPTALVIQVIDVTSRREAQRMLRRAAYRDTLTGLPNAHAFGLRLADLSARAAVDGKRFAVLCLEVDLFQRVNASLGRATAHAMLRSVGQRIASSLRAVDTVARIGDDAFAVCAPGVVGPDAAMALAQLIRAALERPVRAGEIELIVGLAVGVTIGGDDDRTPEELVHDADLAAHAARSEGRGQSRLYTEGMHERLRQRLEIEGELLRALGDGGLHLDFQPLFDLRTMAPCGLEALLRWTHPRLGPISPGVFVPLAEETDQITAITDYVLERAVAQLGAWQRESLLWPGFRLHVNVSGKDLARQRLPANLARLLQLHGVSGSQLSLEITETALMQRIHEVDATLQALQAMGVGLDIDDFGTGYSSLAYLGSVPFDTLKIDRSFVAELTKGPEAVEIVRTIVALAHNLQRRTLAEGIETETQRDLLRDLGVDAAQGYLFARPMGADAARVMLASHASSLGVPTAVDTCARDA